MGVSVASERLQFCGFFGLLTKFVISESPVLSLKYSYEEIFLWMMYCFQKFHHTAFP